MFYEVYVKPTNGPCSVNERDDRGRYGWVSVKEAIELADRKKKQHFNMDFLVHEVVYYSSRKLVYDTSVKGMQ